MTLENKGLFSSFIKLFFITSLFTSHYVLASDYVGSTAGEFRVDESGAATYQVPIDIPAGRADVQPPISLNYSSKNLSEGLMGVGWSLSASSAITRCPPTPVQDGKIEPITFTTQDKFCLDGQRLIKMSGGMGANGSTYRLEIDNFAKITAHGAASETGNPKYFKVETKSGETHYYGDASAVYSAYSGADAFVEPGGSPENSKAKAWMLKAVEDVKGNYITYHYDEDTSKGISILASVKYSGHRPSNLPTFAEVEFVYTSKQKGFGGYYYGSPVLNNQLLETINTWVDGELYRRYNLTYENSALIEERILLTSIEECAEESNGVMSCKPPLTFEWERPNLATVSNTTFVCEQESDISREDCFETPTTTNYSPYDNTAYFLNGVHTYDVRIFDIDGDGKDDVIYEQDWNWNVRLASSPSITRQLTNIGVGSGKKENVLVMDANGDGVRDLLVANGSGQNWYYVSYADGVKTFRMVGSGVKAYGFEGKTVILDVNGDGREDIVYQSGSYLKAYIQPSTESGVWTTLNLYSFAPNDVSQFDNKSVSQSGDIKSSSFFDVNGDGRSDVIVKVTRSESYCSGATGFFIGESNRTECEQDLGGTWYESTTTTYDVLVSSGTMSSPILEKRESLYGNLKNVRPADINGDGLSDIFYVVGSKWYYRLSTGTSFLPADDSGLSANDNYNYMTQFIDLNRDGRADVLRANSTTSASVYFSRANNQGASDVIFVHRGYYNFGNNKQVQYGDVNGDSKLDLLVQDGGTWSYRTKRPNIPDYVIKRFETSFGVGTDVRYLPSSYSSVYVAKPQHASLPSDTISPRNLGFLVSSVYSDVSSTEQVGVKYEYEDYKLNTQGRGALGFETLRTIDLQSDIVTETTYHQNVTGNNFALVGMPLSTTQKRGNVLISSSENALAVRVTNTFGLFPYIQSSTEYSYFVDTNAVSSKLAGRTVSSMTYDGFGNLTNSVVTQYDQLISYYHPKIETITVNEYAGTDEQKRLGRLSRTDVTKTRNGANPITRRSDFGYNADDMLEWTVRYGDGVTQNYSSPYMNYQYVEENLKTMYQYDKFGNKVRVCTAGSTSATMPTGTMSSLNYPLQEGYFRCADTTYYEGGRYVHKQINGFNLATTYKYNQIASAPSGKVHNIQTIDANGVLTSKEYGSFGEHSKTVLADGTYETVSTVFSSEHGAHFKTTVTKSTGATTTKFLDRWGREVASSQKYRTSGSQTDDLIVKTTYDNQGRVKTVSQPNAFTNVTTNNYDVMGRVVSVTRPDGVAETVDYVGESIISTNGLGQTTTERKNIFGETTSSEDNLGNRITFSYDAYSQLVSTSNNFNNQQITAKYDTWGRKVETSDPDMGTWTYQYNEHDELVWQRDAKYQSYHFEYDRLGRMIDRYNSQEGTTCWVYGNASAGINQKGRLLEKALYNGSNVTCSSSQSRASASAIDSEKYTYDNYGRLTKTEFNVDGVNYSETVSYSTSSKLVDTITMDSGLDSLVIKHVYDSLGNLQRLENNNSGIKYWESLEFNGRGLLQKSIYGNAMITTHGYDINGFRNSTSVTRFGTSYYLSDVDLDDAGNVIQRDSFFRRTNGSNSAFSEVYGYDDLNRLRSRAFSQTGTTSITGGFTATQFVTYDSAGNIKFKTGSGYYKYDDTKPNRLLGIYSSSYYYGTPFKTMSYDNNGNIESDGTRTFTYTAFNKPSRITKNSTTINMIYGADRNMINKIHDRMEGSTRVVTEHTYAGAYERIVKTQGGNLTEHKYHLMGGSVVVTNRSNNSSDVHYLHKDTQGSVSMITDATGNIDAQYLYEAFGKQVKLFLGESFGGITFQPPTHKGYTGHHELNSVDVIHMNGRIYDPTLGRFLQADPHIQAPNNTQNYNRYSYVLNNPMSYTDPSGYFFKTLFKKINKALGKFAPVVAFGLALLGQGWAAQGIWQAATLGFATGGIATGSLKGALIGALTGAAFQHIGQHFKEAGWHNDFMRSAVGDDSPFFKNFTSFGGNTLTSSQVIQQISAHAAVGGIAAELAGGKFGHGFISAGVTKGAGGFALPSGNEISDAQVFEGAIISGIIGGTISKLSGGKFSNGAATGAFQFLLNQASDTNKKQMATATGHFNISNLGYGKLSVGELTVDLSIPIYINGGLNGYYDVKLTATMIGLDLSPLAVSSINSHFTIDLPRMQSTTEINNLLHNNVAAMDGFTASFAYGLSYGDFSLAGYSAQTLAGVSGIGLGWYGASGAINVEQIKYRWYLYGD